MASEHPSLTAGHVLGGRYVLERVIGEGGMGMVFAARHRELGEVVAIKVLHASAKLEDDQLERFLREARLAARIKSEHVVRVIDVARGSASEPPYIVMEWLAGKDLGRLIEDRGRLPPSEAIDYVLQACEALAEAHNLGIVHRDLKPSNLLLSKRANGAPLVKVLDFGISKAHADEATLTVTGDAFGSPAYMSPEQIRSAKHVDERTDVWALGVVLFELITGKLPFRGRNASAILAAVSADEPVRLTELAPAAPLQLEEVLAACLVKDRERRVASIGELAARIAPFATEAGRVSAENIQRISSRIVVTQEPVTRRLPPTDVAGTAYAATSTPAGVDAQDALRRTQGAVVSDSQRIPRTSILVGIALAVLLSAGIVGTFLVSTGRLRRSPPPPPVAATAAPSVPVVEAPTVVAPAGTPDAATANVASPSPPPVSPPPRPGTGGHGAKPRPTAPPATSAAPKVDSGLDTSQRR